MKINIKPQLTSISTIILTLKGFPSEHGKNANIWMCPFHLSQLIFLT